MRNKTILAALVAGAVTAAACSSGGADTAGPGAQDAAGAAGGDGKKTIVMEVTGAKKADITFGLGTDQSQDNGATLPWKKTLTSTEALLIATLVAQNKGSGTIGCKITVNGKVAKTNASKGEYAVVTCDASDL